MAFLLAGVLYATNFAAYRYWPLSSLRSFAKGSGLVAEKARQIIAYRYEREEEKAAEHIRDMETAFKAEGLKPWEGKYTRWDEDIWLSRTMGFAYWQTGCLGVYGIDSGPIIEWTDDVIRLRSEYVSELERDKAPTIFVPVHWGGRHYLVRPEDMAEFCKDSPKGYDHLGFVRSADLEKPIFGPPTVPVEYESLIDHSLVQGTITWIGPVTTRREEEDNGNVFFHYCLRARLDIGRTNGIEEGRQFLDWDPQTMQYIRAMACTDDTCEVQCNWYVHESQRLMMPEVGWRLSAMRLEDQDPDSEELGACDELLGGEETNDSDS